MLNPFDADRGGGFGGGGFGAGGGVSRFAPERELPPEIARAYAAVTPPYERAIPFNARWNVWASAFGGANNTNGDPNGAGSANFSARTGGVAAGLDYKLSADTLIGFALAGGGTSWSLAQGLGGGRSDVFQAGLYGSQKFGPWYLSGRWRSPTTGPRPPARSPSPRSTRSTPASMPRAGAGAPRPATGSPGRRSTLHLMWRCKRRHSRPRTIQRVRPRAPARLR